VFYVHVTLRTHVYIPFLTRLVDITLSHKYQAKIVSNHVTMNRVHAIYINIRDTNGVLHTHHRLRTSKYFYLIT